MKIKGTVRGLATGLATAETFLDEMQGIMEGGGLECDDLTVLQKLQKLDVSTILESGGELVDNIKEIYDLISNVADAVT